MPLSWASHGFDAQNVTAPFLSMGIGRCLDKKWALLLGCLISAASNGILTLIFVSGPVPAGCISSAITFHKARDRAPKAHW